LFEKRDLMALLCGDPLRDDRVSSNQIVLLWKLTGQQCIFIYTSLFSPRNA
jgi:hypothetical protein